MGIFHHLALKNLELKSYVQELTGLTPNDVDFLIWLGAVYVNKSRTTKENLICRPGDYLRIHSTPRRFPHLLPQVIFENEDFVIVDKPSGIPTHATVDNLSENALNFCRVDLSLDLKLTHRLDTETSGCLLFAKSTQAQADFNRLLQTHQIKKIYSLLVDGCTTKTGLLEHWMKPSDRAPKELSSTPVDSWQLCQLEILRSIPSEIEAQTLVTLRLITGRTHQIRAQMSASGHPLVGDSLYGSQAAAKVQLRCEVLSFPWRGQFLEVTANSLAAHLTSDLTSDLTTAPATAPTSARRALSTERPAFS